MQLWEMPDDLLQDHPAPQAALCVQADVLLDARPGAAPHQVVLCADRALGQPAPVGDRRVRHARGQRGSGSDHAVSRGTYSVLQELWDRDLITREHRHERGRGQATAAAPCSSSRAASTFTGSPALRGAAEGGHLDLIEWAVKAAASPARKGATMYRLGRSQRPHRGDQVAA